MHFLGIFPAEYRKIWIAATYSPFHHGFEDKRNYNFSLKYLRSCMKRKELITSHSNFKNLWNFRHRFRGFSYLQLLSFPPIGDQQLQTDPRRLIYCRDWDRVDDLIHRFSTDQVVEDRRRRANNPIVYSSRPRAKNYFCWN